MKLKRKAIYEILERKHNNTTLNRKTGRTKIYTNCTMHCILILMMFLLHILCERPWIEDVQDFRVYEIDSYAGGKVKVNPDGLLNPIRSYIHSACMHFERKRTLSTELALEIDPKDGINIYKRVVYSILKKGKNMRYILRKNLPYTGDLLEYMQDYNNVHLQTFYLDKEYMSLQTNNANSFYMLLKSNVCDCIDLKILGSLLLLSEGLDVPLVFNEDSHGIYLVLKKVKENAKDNHFKIKINILDEVDTDKKTIPAKKISLEKTQMFTVINFFIKHRANPVIEQFGFVEPTSYDEYITGRFMNSPWFFIEFYVYYYIRTINKVKEFIKTVHDLLCEYLPDKETQEITSTEKTATRIFNKFFVRLDKTEEEEKNDITRSLAADNRWDEIENMYSILIGLCEIKGGIIVDELEKKNIYIKKSIFFLKEDSSFIYILLKEYMIWVMNRISATYNELPTDSLIKDRFFVNSNEYKSIIGIVGYEQIRVLNSHSDLIISLLVRAMHLNVDKNHSLVRIIDNMVQVDMISPQKTLAIELVALHIVNHATNYFPNIKRIDNIISGSNKRDRMNIGEIADMFVYLARCNALHALSRLIISYMHVRRKTKILLLSTLITRYTTEDERQSLLCCLTRNGRTLQYIKHIVNIALKEKNTTGIGLQALDIKETLLVLLCIAVLNSQVHERIIPELFEMYTKSAILKLTETIDKEIESFSVDFLKDTIYALAKIQENRVRNNDWGEMIDFLKSECKKRKENISRSLPYMMM
ncbi:hypothetical protein NEIRO03_1560 [Nematocida sp. AWRm78]|nr:hypothetical protein NEIRO02_1570 [Nematocida sp. AWRm79]KAI5184094.1 hypothetical protein NEIRO03_1560 [Nematocida sp. AWRm78]